MEDLYSKMRYRVFLIGENEENGGLQQTEECKMLKIKEIVNGLFTSKTYILSKLGEQKAWLVDIGDIEPVLSFLKKFHGQTERKGIMTQHAS